MSLLNQKEEVLKVQLTKHGRKLLGTGVFQPKYFSFFDDSVVYDTNYGGINESTNSIQDRILYKSLTFDANNLLTDVLDKPLGTSDTINDYAPAWKLNILKGAIEYRTENSSYYKKIFDVATINYYITLDKTNIFNVRPKVQEDYVLIDLQELNVADDNDNFEIEVVTFDDISGHKEKKLFFHNKKTNIIDDIIYEESELPSNFFNYNLTSSDVAYYLDVLVDDEIDTSIILSGEATLAESVKATYKAEYQTGPVGPEC